MAVLCSGTNVSGQLESFLYFLNSSPCSCPGQTFSNKPPASGTHRGFSSIPLSVSRVEMQLERACFSECVAQTRAHAVVDLLARGQSN